MTSKVSRSFRPSLPASIALFLLAGLFASLGGWQTNRAIEKSALEKQHEEAPTMALETALEGAHRFARVEVQGRYDTERHFLLDNQIFRGRAGVHVFTPFYTRGGITILVNRGWLPLVADRQSLPTVTTPQQPLTLRGMINVLPVPGRTIGQADKLNMDQWPQLVTYLKLEDIATALRTPLENSIIQLSEGEGHGFEGRNWKPVFLSSERHKGYAFQWFALTTACIVLWLLTSFRKPMEIVK